MRCYRPARALLPAVHSQTSLPAALHAVEVIPRFSVTQFRPCPSELHLSGVMGSGAVLALRHAVLLTCCVDRSRFHRPLPALPALPEHFSPLLSLVRRCVRLPPPAHVWGWSGMYVASFDGRFPLLATVSSFPVGPRRGPPAFTLLPCSGPNSRAPCRPARLFFLPQTSPAPRVLLLLRFTNGVSSDSDLYDT